MVQVHSNGGNFTLQDGDSLYISSPNYPANYDSNTDVLWVINMPEDCSLVLSLLSFNTEDYLDQLTVSSESEADQSVVVMSRFSSRLGPYNRTYAPSTLMRIQFRTDRTLELSGFYAKLRASCSAESVETTISSITASNTASSEQMTQVHLNGGNFALQDGDSLYISSPNYPAYYDSNTNVLWVITMPEDCSLVLSVLSFFTENSYDQLTVSSESGADQSVMLIDRFTSHLAQFNRTYAPSTLMRIRFRSDRTLELSGFEAELRASCSAESVETTFSSITASNTASSAQLTQVHSNEAVETTISYITASNTASSEQMVQVHSNGGNFTLQDEDSLYISSPNYPANYDSNTDVLWVINMPEDCSLVLSLLSFNTEDYLDQLTVSSESEADQSVVVMSRFSSRLGPYNRTYAPSTLMRIQFRTDRTLELSGFYAKLRASCSAESVETTVPSITASNTASSEQMTQVHSNGGNFALQDGDSLYISSPNYPANYDSNTNVLWVITMPEDCSLVLSVLSFFTENSYDALTISSESGADQSVMLIDRFTSHLAPFNRTYAPSTLMRIRFRTDRSLELSGFYAKLRASCSAESVETTISSITASNTASSEQLTQVHSNGGNFALQDGDSLYISSPNYPANYDSNANVLWVITMPEDCSLVLSVLSFFTENSYDQLTVSSESGADQSVMLIDRFTSHLAQFNRTYAPSTLMRIRFRSGRTLELSGFEAELRVSCSVEAVETTFSSITASNTASSEQLTQVHSNEAVETTISYITASNTASSEQMVQVHSNGGNFTLQDGDSLYISSPNYPANYDSNTDVLWVINMPEDCSLVLSLLSFNTEDYLDQLTVSSESEADQSVVVMSRFSSRLGPYNRTYAPSTLMRIQFRTDRTLELSGFYAKLRASCSAESVETTIPSITASNTASSEQMTQVHSNGGNFALQDGDSLYISSPNYPANYDSNANVLWVITMPEDCSLVLSVLSFFTENSYDQLTVSSESGADQSVMLNDRFTSHLAQFNKTYAPSTLMRIRFRTDRTLELSGFYAKLRASCSAESVETTIPSITASNTASSEQMVQVHSNGGNFALQDGDSLYISSPNYPANYDSNARVLWVINMPEDCSLVLSVLSFFTEYLYDALTVSSESGVDQSVMLIDRFTSHLAPFNRTYAPSTLMRIRFRTDRTLELSGFYAKLRASCRAESVETTISSITASNTASSEQLTQVHSNEAGETAIPSITASNTASSEQMVQVHSRGGNFALQDGDSLYISSPNYPANYNSNARVLWVITMPEDCSLVLSVLSFFTENSYDQLTVSSESGADQSVMLIDRFTSHLAPFNRTYAPSTLMRIRFRTDRTLELSGFYAKLRASCSAESVETTISSITASNTASSEQLTQVHSNGGNFALQDEDSLYISSPNYPANYNSNANVLWVITMPEDCSLVLSVLSFFTENSYDQLTVSSESGADQSVMLINRFTSHLAPFIRTYAPSTLMRIRFRTDSSVVYQGFEAELRASCSAETTTASQTTRQTTQDYNDMTSEAPWTIGGNVDSTGGPIALREGQDYFIGSSSFPSNYPSNATILWQVTTSDRCAIHITFMAFSTEPIYDYLVVGSQDVTPKNMVHRWTGGEVPAPLHLNSNQAWFLFMSDSETEEQGFVAKLHAMCSNSTASIEDVRLVDGNVPQEGRLEVLYQGQWGTVCEDLWERTNAEVVCRMLGYEGADLEYSTTDLWWLIKGSGPILMDNVRCQGNESSLDECSHLGLGVHNCDHSKDVGVTCRTGSEANPSIDNSAIIRLVNGNRPSEGRVEVFRGRSWGTVCDDYWGIEDANVACKMLGYERAELAYREAKFGEGDGAILLDDVSCTGREPSLFACDHSDFADCSHAEDAGVKCLETSGRDLSLA
ncbi:CUB and sushi domain-containing protein 2 isoform X2 [Strongylocentrotus purpuratus]|uniref:Deleted in malignant brain tumors 1 protein n=1 Tax=Strongylocentrotus purpuratus TaxID=7668 RepID=A0A7M7PM59_STRPU|nr:CUB and sushi domain-containing protein 2 isoform X2 [Strongylocentrotus purpuratus]